MQVGAIDFQAMTMALAALLVAPLPKLNRHKPPGNVCHWPILMIMAVMAFCLYGCLTFNMVFMASHSWYHGGTGTQRQVMIHLKPLHDTFFACQAPFFQVLAVSSAVKYDLLQINLHNSRNAV